MWKNCAAMGELENACWNILWGRDDECESPRISEGALKRFVGEGPFCKRVSSPTPPPPKILIVCHRDAYVLAAVAWRV
ncbi:hypothetical protein KL86DES1_21566 [uncultured Desulfovibrio sp.]|uniref:Uncharacterized protein n=1 Tax=uncultured Desulfovibrio sp. TaxID=167968 RepID=A0A212L918_9BACT|nr:hypothetical protein KL86DES1_21566 [uncultured Desulfovibrio sp.]VZH34466.1 conserved protein of unknown function [Desulfovibrio sp. 86]